MFDCEKSIHLFPKKNQILINTGTSRLKHTINPCIHHLHERTCTYLHTVSSALYLKPQPLNKRIEHPSLTLLSGCPCVHHERHPLPPL